MYHKKALPAYLFWFIIFLFTYCSSGNYRAEKFSPDNANPGKIAPKDKDIDDTFKIRPIAKTPYRLGIFLSEKGGDNWRFTEKDKMEIVSVCEDLKKKGILSTSFFISQNIITNQSQDYYGSFPYRGNPDSLRNIRLGAARYNADVVLILDSKVSMKRNTNPLSILYLTIIGLWIFPGTSVEVNFTINSSLWDTRSEFLFLTSESEGTGKILRPAAILDESDVIVSAKEESIQRFKKDLLHLLVETK